MPDYEKRLDEGNTYTYIGVSVPGTSDSEAKWRISRMDEILGVTRILYAQGSVGFNKVWDMRSSYEYL